MIYKEQIYEVKVVIRSLSEVERSTQEIEQMVKETLSVLDEDVVKVSAIEVYKGDKDVH